MSAIRCRRTCSPMDCVAHGSESNLWSAHPQATIDERAECADKSAKLGDREHGIESVEAGQGTRFWNLTANTVTNHQLSRPARRRGGQSMPRSCSTNQNRSSAASELIK